MTRKGGNYFSHSFCPLLLPIQQSSGYRSSQLMFLTCQPHGFRVCRSAATQKALFPMYTAISTAVPGYVFHSAFFWDCLSLPKIQAGLFAIWQQGDHFLHRSEKQSPSALLPCLKSEGAQGEVLSMSCSVPLNLLNACKKEVAATFILLFLQLLLFQSKPVIYTW